MYEIFVIDRWLIKIMWLISISHGMYAYNYFCRAEQYGLFTWKYTERRSIVEIYELYIVESKYVESAKLLTWL